MADVVSVASLGPDVRFALEVVADAVELVRSVEPAMRQVVRTKADASPVSVADLAIQALVAARLARDYDRDALVAEETARELREDGELASRVINLLRRALPGAEPPDLLRWIDRGGAVPGSRFWALDPVDGTKGLLHGRQYATVLARISDGRVQIGAIACPHLRLDVSVTGRTTGAQAPGGIAVAARGRGAWWTAGRNGPLAPIRVSRARDLSGARILRSWEDRHGDLDRLERTLRTCRHRGQVIRMDGQAKHVALAAGAADVLLRFPPAGHLEEAIWDCAAGTLVVEEAGGRVTDLAGGALDFGAGRTLVRNRGYVASNGVLHDATLRAVHEAAASA